MYCKKNIIKELMVELIFTTSDNLYKKNIFANN